MIRIVIMKEKKQTHLLLKICCILLFAIFNGCNDSDTYDNPGIVFAFDDYFPETWEPYLDLFDKHDAKVTFFVMGNSVSGFMLHAQSRGHEIGYHTINHPHLPELSKELFFKQTISCMDIFKDAGIELSTFAYTYGDYKTWMHKELLKYYKVVRGFNEKKFKLYSKNDMKSGFIDSKSIDNIIYKSEADFRKAIDNMIILAKERGKIIALTSHRISGYDWGITPERLEYVLAKCQEHGLTFYRYKDLQ